MNSSSPPETLFVFFVDRSLGGKIIPEALEEAGETVKTHDEIFEPNTPDSVWLRKVGEENWIVLTKDSRIRYRANEMSALRRAAVRALVLTARGDLTGAEMAAIFVRALPRIKTITTENPAPFIARVQRDASVEIIRRG